MCPFLLCRRLLTFFLIPYEESKGLIIFISTFRTANVLINIVKLIFVGFQNLPDKYFDYLDTCKCLLGHLAPLGPLGSPRTPKEKETDTGTKSRDENTLSKSCNKSYLPSFYKMPHDFKLVGIYSSAMTAARNTAYFFGCLMHLKL